MTHKALEEYFHKIVNTQPPKEQTMFERSKAYFQSLKDSWSSLYKWDVEIESNETAMEGDYWAFEMYTEPYVNEEGKRISAVHSMLIEPHETTGMEVLDKILDEMEKHYGYNIKEQVYYSVSFPLNIDNEYTGTPLVGKGRCLNDEVLQQLLLAFPEVYETFGQKEFTLA
jgi:hypothetical protein